MSSPYIPLFELVRGGSLESLHFGAAAIVNAQGQLVARLGDPYTSAYLRSSAKPLQALPFVEHGGPKRFDLTSAELAIICASHSGTDEHVAVIQSIQTKISVSEADLLCGIHPCDHMPTFEAMLRRDEEPSPNRNNCSGKHSGMLAYARLQGWPIADYINPAHPVQQSIVQTFSEMCGLPAEQIIIGVDGCSVPAFAVPLYNAALAYARLRDPTALPANRAAACRAISSAMMAHPEMVGGPNSFDTLMMKATSGKILSKGGAEGYQAAGVMPGALGRGSPGLGIVLKISDGDLGVHTRTASGAGGRVRPAVMLEILRQLGVLVPKELTDLAELGPIFAVRNHRRIVTGEGRPCFELAS